MRVLAVTNLYPNPYQPHRAPFNRQQLRALAAQHELAVIAPIAWTDELMLRRPGGAGLMPGRRAICDGMAVDHPLYLFPPKVLRGWYGHCFRESIRARFMDAVEEIQPDVIYATWAYPDGWAAVELAREAGLPVAVKVHGSDILLLGGRGGRRRRTIEVLSRADAVVAVSRHLAGQVAALGADAQRVSVVYNGIDKTLFHPGEVAPPERNDEPPLVLYVGNLLPVKGLDVLIDACDRLARRGVHFDCRLIGQGPMKRAIERQIRERSLEDRVKLLGPRPLEELPAWYRKANLLVLPSRSEGVPNVVLEALACRTPVVATRVGGVSEIIGNDGLVAAGDAAALATAIEAALMRKRETIAPKFVPPGWDESAAALGRVLQGLTRRSTRLASEEGGARRAA
ncbi:MAG: family glycosyltransferase [Phycisphaerales bacterium]|nr:family glycosyltransferase [Phycisphaerales bacterium]